METASHTPQEAAGPGSSDTVALSERGRTIRVRRVWRTAVIVCVLAALAHNVASTWLHWGDLIIDSGRELDTPKQLLAGKVLYKDVRYWYGPLAPYTNTLLYRLFGTRVGVLTAAGIVSAALLAWLAYRLVRLFAGRLTAAAAAVAFLYINAFGQHYGCNIFSFPLPYTYSATYGILLAVASVYFLLRHARRGRPSDFLLSCVFLALTALCKMEVIFAAGAAHLVFLGGWLLAGRLKRLVYPLGYVGAIVVVACVYGGFYARAGEALWRNNLFLAGNLAASQFNLEQAGLLDWAESLRQIGLSACGMVVCLLGAWAVAGVERRIRQRVDSDSSAGSRPLIVLVTAGMLVCGSICYALGPTIAFRSLPLLLLACFVVCGTRWLRSQTDRAAQVPVMVLCAFGLAAIPRRLLRCGADHYGFYLMVPALLGFAVLWCRLLPAYFSVPRGSRQDDDVAPLGVAGPSVGATACGIAMLIALAGAHWTATQQTMKDYFAMGEAGLVRTPQGTLPCLFSYEDTVDAAVRFLQTKPPETTVVAFPEGAAVTFLAGCTNPLGIHSFLPLDFTGAWDEAGLIRELSKTRPDVILILSRGMSEHGAKGFGIDYGTSIVTWVKAEYKAAERFRSFTYEVAVFERR